MALMIATLTGGLRAALVAAIRQTDHHVLRVREFQSRQEEEGKSLGSGIPGRFLLIGDT